jgi:hypothetical protein
MSVISAIRERPKVQAPDIRADEAKIKPPGRRAFFRKAPGSENRQEMALDRRLPRRGGDLRSQ